MSNFKPLLSAAIKTQEDLNTLQYPIMCSPKLDGIRVLIKDGIPVTRSLKPVRNRQVQNVFKNILPEGLDGEIIVGDPCDPHAFRRTTSGVMAEDGVTDFVYHVFDMSVANMSFGDRFLKMQGLIESHGFDFVKVVPHVVINNVEELLTLECNYLSAGYEGVMIRSMAGEYKHGRSTLKQGILIKMKRGWRNSEQVEANAIIVGFKERMQNNNILEIDLLGHAKRTTHKENMVGRDDLGAFMVKVVDGEYEGVLLDIGQGVKGALNDTTRKEFWDNQDTLMGQELRFTYFSYGDYDKPRFPQFICLRDKDDS